MNPDARQFLSVALLGVLVGCVGERATVPSLEIPAGAVDVSWSDAGAVRILQQSYSGYSKPVRLLIDDDAAWAQAWTTLNVSRVVSPPAPRPAVDFAHYSVIIAAQGSHGTGGFGIEVTRLAASSDFLYAEVTSTSPGARCFTTQAFTEPVDVIRIPKPHLPLMFVEHSVVSQC